MARCQLFLTALQPAGRSQQERPERELALPGGPEEEDLCLHYQVNSVFILDIKQ